MNLLSIYWNPNRDIFTIPYIDRPVAWYGLFFILGFIIGYWIVVPMFVRLLKDAGDNRPEAVDECRFLTDKLTWFVIFGTLIGARLGHVFFYYWPYYRAHPLDIFKVWEGGLASHGGIIGILIAIFFYTLSVRKKYPTLTFFTIVDVLCIPSALAGFFIRVGNFINQEILGTETNAPWAVVFGDPADGSIPVPRHPVQLYEGLAVLFLFFVLWTLWWRTNLRKYVGATTGIFFILLFSSRILFEHFKESQSIMRDESWITTGQLLSFPFILLGLALVYCSLKQKKNCY
ncbi:MAG: prolipoprotein diacylglyceryl transferase [Parachlamydiales bacterium]|jgi:prolipoprotein diacylglyceryl transferase